MSVPASYREAVRNDPYDAIYVLPHFDGPYLECGGEAFVQQYRMDIASLPRYDRLRKDLEVAVLGAIRRLDFDSTGRVTLPKEFIAHASIEGHCAFVGCDNHFQIWNAQTHADRLGAIRGRLAERLADPAEAERMGGGSDLAALLRNSESLQALIKGEKL
ncbi:MAG: division/cell wall cluster transcriptional repressor MraZ [Robiginitomaculum sp.]|nr:MAG: division/cell wall cluster transcriptional repressor MraZ [Robiginitomaculum sp.]